MTSILVIPDSHAKPGVSNKRYEALGHLVVDRKPDIIVSIGDWYDMPSLSHYDVGKRSAEGRRYVDDIIVGNDALDAFHRVLDNYNRLKKKKYDPKRYVTLGNHEERVNRAANESPALYGSISQDDFDFENQGWHVQPFKTLLHLEGINFTHYFPNGLMDRAIGGQNIGRTIIQRMHKSGIQGHNHILNTATDVDASGKRIWGITSGCFFEHEEEYVSSTIQMTWWRGVLMLNDVNDGDFNLETINYKTVMEMYG